MGMPAVPTSLHIAARSATSALEGLIGTVVLMRREARGGLGDLNGSCHGGVFGTPFGWGECPDVGRHLEVR
jgi:hypothetical protein